MKKATARASVLIVDDIPQNISLLNVALMGEYTIKVATSGIEAIDICLSLPVDIILLDVMMPDMDGPGVIGELHGRPETAGIPVIFLTAKAQSEEADKLRRLGAIDVIAKPFDPMTLAAEVKAAWLRWRG